MKHISFKYIIHSSSDLTRNDKVNILITNVIRIIKNAYSLYPYPGRDRKIHKTSCIASSV